MDTEEEIDSLVRAVAAGPTWSRPLRPGEVLSDRFVIERIASAGGMGTVYRATDRASGALVAVKTLRARGGDATRFVQEAQLLAELEHPAIVRHVAHGAIVEGELFLAMEWLEGETLAERLGRAPLSLRDSIALAARTADALAVAHASGIVHRDIKPANLILRDREPARVTLVDFGVARDLRAARAMTRTGGIVGTLGYLAPEQARGDRDLSAAADVFSLGCVLFECLTGRPAFQGESSAAILASILLDEAPDVLALRSDVPASLGGLLARMLAKNPRERPASAVEVVEGLAAFVDLDGPPPRSADKPAASSQNRARELQFVTVVLVAPAIPRGSSDTIDANASEVEDTALRQLAARSGATCHAIADGSMLFAFGAIAIATDRAAIAGRIAHSIRATSPARRVVVATGRAEVQGKATVGEAVDRAAALLAAAEDAILVDDVTAGLLGARFEVLETLRGRVLGEERAPDSEQRLLGRSTSCVGRDRELGMIEAIATEAFATRTPAAVLVIADAGVGKSRLQYELGRRLAARVPELQIWRTEGTPLSADSPLAMISTLVRRSCGIANDDPVETRRDKLVRRVATHVPRERVARVAAFLGELLGLHFDASATPELGPARIEPRWLVREIERAWDDFLAAETAAHPVLLVLEDLHWGDAATVDRIDAVLGIEDRALTVLALARPSIAETLGELWRSRGVQELRLRELPRRACIELARQVLGDVDDEILVAIVERCAGHAFFLEELLRNVAAARPARASEIVLPDTAIAMLESRLSHLTAWQRRVLGAASVLGETFWVGAVAAMLEVAPDAAELSEAIHELVEHELIGRSAESRYRGALELRFRHALVREAAYATLHEVDKVAQHAAAGAWLEQQGEPDLGVLAYHFECAMHDDASRARAGAQLKNAAVHAYNASAPRAAQDFAERGLVAVAGIGDARVRVPVEIGLHFALGQAFVATRGYAVPEVEREFATGLELAESLHVPPITLQCLLGMFGMQTVCGRYRAALVTSERAVAIAETLGVPHLLLEAVHTAWTVRVMIGDYATARRHIETGLALFEAASSREIGVLVGVYPEVHCFAMLGWVEAMTGHAGAARDATRRAVALATAKQHGFSLGVANVVGAVTAFIMGDLAECRALASAALAIGREQRLPWVEGMASVWIGHVEASAGEVERGLAIMDRGLALLREMRAVMGWPSFLVNKASALVALGRFEDARGALAEAGAFEVESGEVGWRPERLRVTADLERCAGRRDLAEQLLRESIADARARGMSYFELRAGRALADLVPADHGLREQLAELEARLGGSD